MWNCFAAGGGGGVGGGGVNCTDSLGRLVMSVPFFRKQEKTKKQQHNFNLAASHVASLPATGKRLLTLPADLGPNRPLRPATAARQRLPTADGQREEKQTRDEGLRL